MSNQNNDSQSEYFKLALTFYELGSIFQSSERRMIPVDIRATPALPSHEIRIGLAGGRIGALAIHTVTHF